MNVSYKWLKEYVDFDLTPAGRWWTRGSTGPRNRPRTAPHRPPAAVMVSGELAKEVDFFSIGTNDLTQYTLAVDRQNPKLDRFFDPHHPAILAMIRMVVENAHKAGIWAGICGELGADTSLTKEFLAMGVDELSVSAGSILPIRKIILETDLSQYGKDIK